MAVALAMVACAEPTTAPSERPNLLLISIDTLRADRTTPYGHSLDTTPRLNRLAGDGTLFEVAYSPSSTTGPSHASLFTALYPITHLVRKNGFPLASRFETLAERLSDQGYLNAAFVSSYVLHREFGYDQGFDWYDDHFEEGSAKVVVRAGDEVPDCCPGVRGAFDRKADATTDRALAWLESEADPDRPFFLFLHYFDPHSPREAPRSHRERFSAPERADYNTLDAEIRHYDAEVSFTDDQIERLLRAPQLVGDAANTLIVVTADHGEGLGDHGIVGHGVYLFEGFVRVPLIVSWPGHVLEGRRLPGPVELIDVMPTLLDLLGLDPSPQSRGRSLAEVLQGSALPDLEHPVFLHRRPYAETTLPLDVGPGQILLKGEQYAVRSGRWKHIEAPEEGTQELYDLEVDPGELRDVSELFPEVARSLTKTLREWRDSHATAAEGLPVVSPENRARLEALGYVD